MRFVCSLVALVLAALLPGAAWADTLAPDSTATSLAPARAALISGTYGHFSPGAAFSTGVLCTMGPLAVAGMAQSSRGGASGGRAQGALLAAAGLGVLIGPAIGLASGGRSDLAERGLLVRMAGTGLAAAGFLGVMSSMETERPGQLTTGLFAVGVLGAVATAGSAAIDLLTTPVVVAAGPPRPHAALLVAPDRAGVAVRF